LPQSPIPIPVFPPMLARLLRIAPLAPISVSLTTCARRLAKQHPGLFRRLGEHVHARFVLDPTDLPISLCLEPNGGMPRVSATRGPVTGDARIAGSLAALLGLVNGAYDGDALFFSRDLVIEGDTAAALALRNAVDDAELDISGEVAAMSGPFAGAVRRIAAVVERRTGVYLSRCEEAMAW